MHGLLEKIEECYERAVDNLHLDNVIYDPNQINRGRFGDKILRYDDSMTKNQDRIRPYVLTVDLINELIKNIQLVKIYKKYEVGSGDQINQLNLNMSDAANISYMNEKWVIHNAFDNFIMIEPHYIYDTLYYNNITPLGILSVAMQKHFYNDKFKEWVENNYLNDNFTKVPNIQSTDEVYVHNSKLWILDRIDELIDIESKLVTNPYKNPYIFIWRDYTEYNGRSLEEMNGNKG